ncbi:plasma membrane proteolipid Pmp3 [Extremus antarcticus]|uniref:Plasma membrane proteolipid Pmp3 n=1 Tax=Extremus antarcticus TaxID=702011 RepID=A0AAJ0DKA2_9PEZI|nr:plasma membrane proteolipid Pmp3 [Extremus antarcticus]
MAMTGSDIFKLILAVFIPPLGVFLERGCGADLLINILLTILGYIPGIIHAMYVHRHYLRFHAVQEKLTRCPDTSSSSTSRHTTKHGDGWMTSERARCNGETPAIPMLDFGGV